LGDGRFDLRGALDGLFLHRIANAMPIHFQAERRKLQPRKNEFWEVGVRRILLPIFECFQNLLTLDDAAALQAERAMCFIALTEGLERCT
jgi:hypothetical protein